jgi:hypothetical protein
MKINEPVLMRFGFEILRLDIMTSQVESAIFFLLQRR